MQLQALVSANSKYKRIKVMLSRNHGMCSSFISLLFCRRCYCGYYVRLPCQNGMIPCNQAIRCVATYTHTPHEIWKQHHKKTGFIFLVFGDFTFVAVILRCDILSVDTFLEIIRRARIRTSKKKRAQRPNDKDQENYVDWDSSFAPND